MAANDVTTAAVPAAYKAKQISGNLPQYDSMRARLQQRSNADVQQQQDAMARRFAAQGAQNSGAAIKQQQLIADQGVQNREQGMQDIADRETSERQRLQEAEDQREFQSNEAAVGRQFQAGESALARAQQQKQFDSGQAFQDKWNQIGQSNTLRQLDLADQESNFNRAAAMANMDDDQLYGMGAAGDAFREEKARKKGEAERRQNTPTVASVPTPISIAQEAYLRRLGLA